MPFEESVRLMAFLRVEQLPTSRNLTRLLRFFQHSRFPAYSRQLKFQHTIPQLDGVL